ncbi:MAG: hypothetical protein ACOYXC_01745 [Candidatus Rifleibacteriota bacterium]
MLIANPIYDSVFKYLMEDNRVARLLLGAVIGKNIISLEPRPQEVVITRDNPAKHSVFRMDFSARIKTSQGERLVIVEVQKAKHATDIIRFRRYLGRQYANPENTEKVGLSKRGTPIISIYFLGYPLDAIDAPVLKIARAYTDLTTKKVYTVKNDFIESLTHDSYIIQTSRLKSRRRNELESILTVFDPDNIHQSEHILNVDETEFPEKYREIIRRLRKAAESEEMREIMHVEDEVFEELAAGERAAEERDRAFALIAEKETVIAEKETIITEKETVIAEKESALVEKDRALEKKDQQLNRTVLNLHKSGQTIENISDITGLSSEAVTEILSPPRRVSSTIAVYKTRKPRTK